MPEHAPLAVDVNVVAETDISRWPVLDDRRLASLATSVLAAEDQHGPWEIAFVFVNDSRMRAMHREFMSIDEPTDVMTFPSEPPPAGSERVPAGGDIVISVDRCVIQAVDAGVAPDDELLFVATHGLLHLTGWDDHSWDDRAAMLTRGRSLLDAWLSEHPIA